jgi:undecaprenyl-diphosphatase
VQGLTEFLPVSSSGHLTIFQHFFGLRLKNEILFDSFLHIGTLISVLFVFWSDIKNLVLEFFAFVKDLFKFKPNIRKNPTRRLGIMLILASIPLVFAAIFEEKIAPAFKNVKLVGVALIATSVLLFLMTRVKEGTKTEKDASFLSSLIVGLSQMCAVIPGLSRSGTTISVGTFLGYDKKFAVKFSFLMSMIAVAGAGILHLKDTILLVSGMKMAEISGYLLALLASCLSGIFAIKFLNKLVKRDNFKYFAYYCLVIGAVIAFVG